MRLTTMFAASAAFAALALPGAGSAQSWGGYWYAPPAPQYAPPAAPYWSVAYDPFFSRPMWGYGHYQAPQAWPVAYAGAPRATATRTRAARARDPFRSMFDDPFFTEPWGFGFEPMLTAPWPTAYAGAPSMLGYGSFASDDFWNWARFGDLGDSAWSSGSAAAYSYTARNSNGRCVHVSRTTRNGQTVTHRENCGAAPTAAPAAPDPVYYEMGRDLDE